jgi:aromatic-L-amino-acid decarboxylase
MNERFSGELRKIENIHLPLEPFLNFSCFRLQPSEVNNLDTLNRINETLIEEINKEGVLFLTHTRIKGLYTLRMIIGQTYVEKQDVDRALEIIRKAIIEVLKREEIE